MKAIVKLTFTNTPIQIYAKRWVEPKVSLKRKNKNVTFWTESEIKKLISLYNKKKTAKEIAKAMSRSMFSINSKLQKMLHDQTIWELKR